MGCSVDLTISNRAKHLAEKLQHMAQTQDIYEAIQRALDEERAETWDRALGHANTIYVSNA